MKLISIIILLFLFSVPAKATNIDEYIDYSEASELHDYLDDESKEFLEKAGINGIDSESILDVSPSSVFNAVLGVFREKWKEPMKALISAVGTAIIISVCVSLVPDDEKNRSVVLLVGSSFAVLTLFRTVSEALKACSSCVKICVGFEKLLIPILTALLTASGKPASAISYNGTSFAIAESVSIIADEVVIPISGVVSALYLCSGMFPDIRLNSVADILRKAATYILSVSAALFSGTIAIKNVIASSSDSIGTKAVKLVTSTFVPVVGGALGEAFTSFTGSISLIRNTVGVFGIAALGAICIPVLAETLLWIFSMRIASAISEMLGCQCCVSIYNGIAYICSMMNILLVFCVTVFVISTATVIVTGG